MRNPRFTLTAALLCGADDDVMDTAVLWVTLGYSFAALVLVEVSL
jgi:hypothetical protein